MALPYATLATGCLGWILLETRKFRTVEKLERQLGRQQIDGLNPTLDHFCPFEAFLRKIGES